MKSTNTEADSDQQTTIETVIAQVLAGRRECYETIVQAYEKQIYVYCRLLLRDQTEAEDATQEVFIKAYKGLGSYEKRASFSSWLHRIAYHHCLDRLRSSKRRERLNEACKEQLRSAPPRTHEQEQAVIDRLFEELTPEERNLLLLRAIQQYTFEEIACITGRTAASMRKQFERLKKKLVRQHSHPGGIPHEKMARST
ncbi:RNA polymerase sigma factor [Saccharibacillus sacchari]|uniref:RNA polymerase sigma factor n=1 Tax=Saccharibacillus sacchari TaxID=456493 RepID=UPI0004B60BEF|nr:sigma-70 family RNA polymerase sigma factor [Saccharibacillus sacchari]